MPITRFRWAFLVVAAVAMMAGVLWSRTMAQETETISVSATVPADADDLNVALVQDTAGTRFPQNTELAYTITYSTDLQSSVDLTLTASWSRGTLDGESSPTLDIIDYVPGSASNAYNSTPAVVDTVNRTITWTITSFPAGTGDQTVTFRLKTNDSYQGAGFAAFTVSAQSSGSGTASAISSVTKEYQYAPAPTPTVKPTSAAGPSATPKPGPTSTPGATVTPSPVPGFRFTDIRMETITPAAATVYIETTQNSTVELKYGLAPGRLTETITDLSQLRARLLQLGGLTDNTRYYFQIRAENGAKTAIISDIYTFRTGARGETPAIDRGRTILTSRHVVLYPSADGVFVIPRGTQFELNLVFTNPKTLRRVLLQKPAPYGEMKEIEPGKYIARLNSPGEAARHPLAVRVFDVGGNITDVSIGTLKAVNPLTVYYQNTREPAERARVRLYHHNYRTGRYEFISPNVLAIPNPLYTAADGTALVVLPQGRYRADISSTVSESVSREFVLGSKEGEDFPYINLERHPFSLIPFIQYQWETCMDLLSAFRTAFAGYAKSLRLFELNAFIMLGIFTLLTFLAFRKRIKVPFRSFGAHFGHTLKGSYYSSPDPKKITGVVLGPGESPVSGADVFLINPRHNTVLAHAVSRSGGGFAFPVYDTHRYAIEVRKDGFEAKRFHEDGLDVTADGYLLNLKKDTGYVETIGRVLDNLLSVGLEGLLIISFLLEILFVYVFGFPKTAPFITLSLLNLFLIVLHNLHSREG